MLGTLGFLLGGDAVAGARLRAGDPRLRELARRVSGPLVTRSSPVYDAARHVYNQRFDGLRPLAILRAAGATDVAEAVLWARRHGIRIVARSGGHSYGGHSIVAGGLVVDVGRLSGCSVDRSVRTATIGSGTRLIDVYARLAADGLTIPAGSCPTVGVTGLALGGGIGFASRKLGTTSDNILAVKIVTADGRLLTCDAKHHRDLYWACRGGGGGNFGVVTSFVFRTHPVTSASYFVLSWPWTSMREAITVWQAFAPHAPDALFSTCHLSTGVPQPTVSAFGQYFGNETSLRSLLAPLLAVPGAKLTTGTSNYLDVMRRWAGCLSHSVGECHVSPQGVLERTRFEAKSDYVRTPLPAAAIALVKHWIGAWHGNGKAALLLDAHGGAINRIAAAKTAFVHRRELFSLQYYARSASSSTDAATLAWLRGFHAAMRPYVSGAAYVNYIDPDLEDWPRAYYGANYARLRRVKSAYDPENVFRFAQGIRRAH